MRGVAFQVDRPPHVALNQYAARIAIDWNGRGKEKWLAWNDRVGRLYVGHDRLVRLIGAPARDSPQCQRCRHEPEKIAAAVLVEHLDRRVREFDSGILGQRCVAR